MTNRTKKGFVVTILAVIIVIIVGVVFLFAQIFTNILGASNNGTDEQVASIVINYLEKKYGHQSWSVTSTKTLTTATDVMGLKSTQIGFTAEVETAIADDYIFFEVKTKGTDPSSTIPEKDNFIARYYLSGAKGISNFANTGYTLDPSFSFSEEKIPNDIGHIPTISEIASYGALSQINLYQYDSQSLGSSHAQKAETLKNIGLAVLNHYKIATDTTVVLTSKNDGFHTINISATSITVKISGEDNPYSFPR